MTATATEVKNRFGEFLDRAQRESVTVEKSGRPVAVLVSQQEYERLTTLEDRYWGERALAAAKEPHVGHDEAMAIILTRLEKVESAVSISPEETPVPRPRPRRGSGKAYISYIAPDFDAPLEDMREYSE